MTKLQSWRVESINGVEISMVMVCGGGKEEVASSFTSSGDVVTIRCVLCCFCVVVMVCK